eukprot:gnl/MRDRNA2_/MRDRNA2_56919_c0_seq1.p1 gnl/MRDRNA2_/MRDRNA2_56919_c0~~gnl/MRDRNA2_/MRDRNA2_56919_c0_seq1.p1  ORF type:complete len:1112 (-),score=219.03 gnl/MRDRNA2_/MRDRNA2_56919_c0_seq1:154-3489(-)
MWPGGTSLRPGSALRPKSARTAPITNAAGQSRPGSAGCSSSGQSRPGSAGHSSPQVSHGFIFSNLRRMSAKHVSEPTAAQTFPQSRRVNVLPESLQKCDAGPLDLEKAQGMFRRKRNMISDDIRKSRGSAAVRTHSRRRVSNVLDSIFDKVDESISPREDNSVPHSNGLKCDAATTEQADGSAWCGNHPPASADESGDCCSTECLEDLTSGRNSPATSESSIPSSSDERFKKNAEHRPPNSSIETQKDAILAKQRSSFTEVHKSGCHHTWNGVQPETLIIGSTPAAEHNTSLRALHSIKPSSKAEPEDAGCTHKHRLVTSEELLHTVRKHKSVASAKDKGRSSRQSLSTAFNWRRMSRLLRKKDVDSSCHESLVTLPRLLGSNSEYVIDKGIEIVAPSRNAEKGLTSSTKTTNGKRQAKRSLSTLKALKARTKTSGESAWRSFQHADRVEPAWAQTYNLLANVDGEVKHDILPHALELIGHKEPMLLEWAKKALDGLPGLGEEEVLDRSQFFAFLRGYESIERNALEEEFLHWEVEGIVIIDDLPSLVRKCGITPIHEVLVEAVQKVNHDGTNALSVDEFVDLVRHLQKVAGFTDLELENLHAVFLKYDRDNSSEMNTSELQSALHWCGYPVSEKDAAALGKAADSDGSGCLCEAEFMMVMRRYREQEIACLVQFCGEDVDGRQLKFKDIPAVFAALGYGEVSPELVRELADECNLNPESDNYLNFDDAWNITRACRANGGLCRAQLKELRGVFNRFATSSKGSEQKGFSEVELGWALRWLGIVLPLPRVQELLADADSDGSGRVEWEEFLKLARGLFDAEFKAVQNAFAAAGNPERLPVCTGVTLRDVLLDLGYSPTAALLEPLTRGHQKEANFQEFLYLVADFRKVSQRALRHDEGFTPLEVQTLRKQFQRFDKDGDGTVVGHELRHLIEFVQPAAVSDAKARDQVVSILAEIDTKDQKAINFQQFLRLMRKLEYANEAEQQAKEQHIASLTGFEIAEVREFHHVFAANVGTRGEMSVDGFRRMLRPVVHVKQNSELHRELVQLVEEVDSDGSGGLNFSEFLVALRQLQEINFGNMNGHSERIASSLREPVVELNPALSDVNLLQQMVN